MKVLFDANVLVAAFISRAGTCEVVYRECVIRHAVVVSEPILIEVTRILGMKMKFPKDQVEANAAAIRSESELAPLADLPADACPDPDDLHVLGAAVGAGAGIIVSGDADLVKLGSFRGIRILRPGDLLRELEESASSSDTDSPGGIAAERRPRYGRRRKQKR